MTSPWAGNQVKSNVSVIDGKKSEPLSCLTKDCYLIQVHIDVGNAPQHFLEDKLEIKQIEYGKR
jgi:hypothetical protein